MQLNPETTFCPNLMAVDSFGGRTELLKMSYNEWTRIASAGSKEELDLKLAVRGLEADWSRHRAGTQYRVRRIRQ